MGTDVKKRQENDVRFRLVDIRFNQDLAVEARVSYFSGGCLRVVEGEG